MSDDLEFSSSDSIEEQENSSVTDINNDGGILKEILKKGTGVDKPTNGTEVEVHYTGTLLSGEKFDSSVDRGDPFRFTVGQGQVIKGWDDVIKTMKLGEKAKVTLRSDYAYGDSGSGEKIPPGATLVFEMELISFQNEKDITKKKDKGVLKKIIQAGEMYQNPSYETSVVVSYEVRVHGSDEIVHHVDEMSCVIGEGHLVNGLEIAIESMKSGEKAEFTIAPAYAFGSEGNEYAPPDTTLHYTVTLHSFEKAQDPWKFKEFEQKLEQATSRKIDGNNFFKENRLELALKKYERGLKFIDSDSKWSDEEKAKANELKETLHLNTSLVHFKLGDLTKALKSANDALKINPSNIKALYRKATIEIERDEWKAAKQDLQTILQAEPDNRPALAALKNLKSKISHVKKKEKAMYSNLFK